MCDESFCVYSDLAPCGIHASATSPMPNGRTLSHCAHCERWLACHPWGDPARFYCDDCFAWWDAQVIWWQLGDVFLVRQAGHQDIQHIISDEDLGCLISSNLTWHDVTWPFPQAIGHADAATGPHFVERKICSPLSDKRSCISVLLLRRAGICFL